MRTKKMTLKDIPEEDRDWISPEAYEDVLRRDSDGAEPVSHEQLLREMEQD